MKVITFNLRYCDDADGHEISARAPRLKKILSKYDADIMGFQEVVPEWFENIERDYSEEYGIFNFYRAKTNLEGNTILWKKDKFELLDKGQFWLSDTPDVESKGWDERFHCFRIVIWAKMRELASGKEFIFANTHYGFGDKGQTDSADLIHKRLKDFELPIILIGDFNMKPDSAGYGQITKYYIDVNEMTARDTATTFHGYGRCNGEHIDYCFITEDIIPEDSILITDTVDEKYPSDHYGILSKIKF